MKELIRVKIDQMFEEGVLTTRQYWLVEMPFIPVTSQRIVLENMTNQMSLAEEAIAPAQEYLSRYHWLVLASTIDFDTKLGIYYIRLVVEGIPKRKIANELSRN